LPEERRSVCAIKLDPNDSNTIYIGTSYDNRFGFKPGYVAKSTDGGRTWKILLDNIRAEVLELDPFLPGAVYVGAIQYMHRQEPGKSDKILWASYDDGKTWKGLSTAMFPVHKEKSYLTKVKQWRVTSLVADPCKKGRFYMSFGSASWYDSNTGHGLYVSNDHCRTWELFDMKGLPNHSLAGCVVDPLDSNRIYVLTGGNGVWRYGPASLNKNQEK
jgi:hypothetical protein